MADAVAVTTIEDGARRAVFYLTNISDGSGEANVKKIDVTYFLYKVKAFLKIFGVKKLI